MTRFTNEEQSAVLQCLWQLISAKPTFKDNEYLTKLVSSWKLSADWVTTAIMQETSSAFNIVANMSEDKKIAFKKIAIDIVYLAEDIDYRIRIAMTLFDNKVLIPYIVKAKDWLFPDGKDNKYVIE